MPGILLTYNRHEDSESIARFRREFIQRSPGRVFVGSGSLLSIPAYAETSPPPERKPADHIRALLVDVPAVVFLVGARGLDAQRPGDLFTVRAAIGMGRPVIAVLANGARISAEFSELPTIVLTAQNLDIAVRGTLLMIDRLGPVTSLDDAPADEAAEQENKQERDQKSSGIRELSQEELSALLQAKSFGEGELADVEGDDDPGLEEDSLSQEEIDALLQGADDFSVSSGDVSEGYDLGGLSDANDEYDAAAGEFGELTDVANMDLDSADGQRSPEPASTGDLRFLGHLEGGPLDPDAPAAAETRAVAFTAYLPEQFDRINRQHMYVYAHLADDPEIAVAVERDVERFREELGGEIPAGRRARERAELREDTRITVVPQCDDLLFDPPELTKRWRADWTRFDFEVLLPKPTEGEVDGEGRPALPEPGEIALVRISIQVAGIEIAHVNCSAEFIEEHSNPLAAAKATRNATARQYQKIFISYSRRDFEVTRSYQAAQLALGNEVFVDSESIRAGEDWRAALATAIDSADVMQLFWSKHSALSQNVRDEWEYALQYRCPNDACANFLRPVYWKTPMPAVPPELNHLHFKLVDLQDR